MKQLFLFAALAGIISFSSCKKGLGDENADPFENATPVVTAKGLPLGSATSYPVNSSAKTITSADGRLDIIIPAGAFTTATNISIQPISNLAPLGLATGYRLLPEGTTFAKPITLRFHYTAADLGTAVEDFLWINTQNNDGTWVGNKNSEVDKANKTISIETTHFSDWTMGRFMDLTLTPARATVKVGEKLNMSITGFLENEANSEDLLVPLSPVEFGPNTVVTEEKKLLAATRQYLGFSIKEWTVNGAASGGRYGRIEPGKLRAVYHAPATAPTPPTATITVNLVARKRNLPNANYMLVSNITIIDATYYLKLNVDGQEFMYIQYGFAGQMPVDNNNMQNVNLGINDEGAIMISAGYISGGSNMTNSFLAEFTKTNVGVHSLTCHNTVTTAPVDDVSFMPTANGMAYRNSYVKRTSNGQNCNSDYLCGSFTSRITKFGSSAMSEVEGSFSGKLYFDGPDFSNQCKSSQEHAVSGEYRLIRVN